MSAVAPSCAPNHLADENCRVSSRIIRIPSHADRLGYREMLASSSIRCTMSRSRRSSASTRQLSLFRRGGKRRGAGRKPKGPKALVSHAKRDPLAARHPVLVTTRLRTGLPGLRRPDAFAVLEKAFAGSIAGAEQHGLRLVHFSVQTTHLHFIVEARDARSLSHGMKGLLVRIARGLNHLWRRSGSVFADRFHARRLRTPREVRNALAYVLKNAHKHGCQRDGVDPYSSGNEFDGWSGAPSSKLTSDASVHALKPRTWLLRYGWKRHGLIDPHERPGSTARREDTGVSAMLDMAALRRAARHSR
jgi:putative transposase